MWQVRLAGLSGAASVAAGAAGAHAMAHKDDDWVAVWKTAVQYHQIHTLALLGTAAVPSKKARLVAGGLFAAGTVLFSGTNYLVAYYEDRSLSKTAPVGGEKCITRGSCLTPTNHLF